MSVATVNNVHRTQNSEKEVGGPHALAILEYLALGSAIGQILRGEDPPIVQEPDVSGIEETHNIKDSPRPIPENVPKSENEKEIIDTGEFREARKKV